MNFKYITVKNEKEVVNVDYDYIPKSKYIREKIKGKSFRDEKYRKYIEDLVFIESTILKGIKGFPHGIQYHKLKNKYRKDYLEILKELKPALYKKTIINERIEKEKEKKRKIMEEIEKKNELEKANKWWIKLGGVD